MCVSPLRMSRGARKGHKQSSLQPVRKTGDAQSSLTKPKQLFQGIFVPQEMPNTWEGQESMSKKNNISLAVQTESIFQNKQSSQQSPAPVSQSFQNSNKINNNNNKEQMQPIPAKQSPQQQYEQQQPYNQQSQVLSPTKRQQFTPNMQLHAIQVGGDVVQNQVSISSSLFQTPVRTKPFKAFMINQNNSSNQENQEQQQQSLLPSIHKTLVQAPNIRLLQLQSTAKRQRAITSNYNNNQLSSDLGQSSQVEQSNYSQLTQTTIKKQPAPPQRNNGFAKLQSTIKKEIATGFNNDFDSDADSFMMRHPQSINNSFIQQFSLCQQQQQSNSSVYSNVSLKMEQNQESYLGIKSQQSKFSRKKTQSAHCKLPANNNSNEGANSTTSNGCDNNKRQQQHQQIQNFCGLNDYFKHPGNNTSNSNTNNINISMNISINMRVMENGQAQSSSSEQKQQHIQQRKRGFSSQYKQQQQKTTAAAAGGVQQSKQTEQDVLFNSLKATAAKEQVKLQIFNQLKKNADRSQGQQQQDTSICDYRKQQQIVLEIAKQQQMMQLRQQQDVDSKESTEVGSSSTEDSENKTAKEQLETTNNKRICSEQINKQSRKFSDEESMEESCDQLGREQEEHDELECSQMPMQGEKRNGYSSISTIKQQNQTAPLPISNNLTEPKEAACSKSSRTKQFNNINQLVERGGEEETEGAAAEVVVLTETQDRRYNFHKATDYLDPPSSDRSSENQHAKPKCHSAEPRNEDKNVEKLAKSTLRFRVLGGGETVEAEDCSQESLSGNNANDQNKQQRSVIRINLKNVLEVESYLDQICESLSANSCNYLPAANKFIALINEDPLYSINQAHTFFCDERLSRVCKVLNVLELVSVYLIARLGQTYQQQVLPLVPQMKHLLSYTHQSFLMSWDLLYRLFEENIQEKECLEILRQRIEEKRQVKLGKKKSSFLQLKQNYEILCSIIKPLIQQVHDLVPQLGQLFRFCEDQSTVIIFSTLKSIFQKPENAEESARSTDVCNSGNAAAFQTNAQLVEQCRSLQAYLPPLTAANQSKQLTLVLDLDETLIHFFETRNGGQFLVRPFCEKFLKEMSKLFELVIFTAGTEDYANWVLDILDKSKTIKHRLYRQHTNFNFGVYIKDLSRIGRDLNKVLIVDNVPENFRLQTDNGIAIKSWYSDKNDTALRDLIPLLTDVAKQCTTDIRQTLKSLKHKYPNSKTKGNFEFSA